jgi:RimJ/RimL family protein N-acetyltransferase
MSLMMLKGKNILLRFVNNEDAPFIVNLRLNQGSLLSKTSSSIDLQMEWIKNYKEREKNKEEYYFIIEDKNNNRVGTIRMYDFTQDSFSWGSWLIIEGSPFYYSIESALLIYDFGFNNLKFNKSHFDVDKRNKSVLKFHLGMGAVIASESEKDFYFEYSKEKYQEIRVKYSRYLK